MTASIADVLAGVQYVAETVPLVRTNVKKAQRLSDRLSAVVPILHEGSAATFGDALRNLASVVEDSRDLVASLAKKGWVRKALSARKTRDDFEEVNRRLSEAVADLTCRLAGTAAAAPPDPAVQHVEDGEDDGEDAADLQALFREKS